MYRLLATDIDDTILAGDGSLPEANHQALERLHRRGIPVVFSSGRATVSVRDMARRILPLADDEYLIAFNGARVVTAQSEQVLFERSLPPEVVTAVADYAGHHGLLLHGYDAERFLANRNDPRCDEYARDTQMSYRVVSDMSAALPEGSAKLLIIDDHEVLQRHKSALDGMASGRWVTTFSKPHYLEIISPGVDKGRALTRLAEQLRIPIAETVAVGDSLNDREMLAAAGLGVAVANARAELKEVADVTLERTATEGAIEELVERYFPE
jgi:Cof subfamily protein (haloacid dehalogenase superfamily)